MADLSTLSDAELMALYNQQQQPVQAQPQDLSKMSDAELMALYNQQRTGATQSPIERPDMLTTALEFQGRSAEQVGATLADLVPPPELAADLLKVKSPQGGVPTESNVQAIYGQLERTGSIRDVLNKEVASGGLSPTATLDPQQYPVLAPIWEQYKKEMR